MQTGTTGTGKNWEVMVLEGSLKDFSECVGLRVPTVSVLDTEVTVEQWLREKIYVKYRIEPCQFGLDNLRNLVSEQGPERRRFGLIAAVRAEVIIPESQVWCDDNMTEAAAENDLPLGFKEDSDPIFISPTSETKEEQFSEQQSEAERPMEPSEEAKITDCAVGEEDCTDQEAPIRPTRVAHRSPLVPLRGPLDGGGFRQSTLAPEVRRAIIHKDKLSTPSKARLAFDCEWPSKVGSLSFFTISTTLKPTDYYPT